MNLIKCSTLELYLNKLGGEIKDVDMVFVEDVQEVYVGGQPYGKDPVWNEISNPLDGIQIGDYVTKEGNLIKFADYQDTDRDNLAGIYIGDHPETNEKLLIPASTGFTYNSQGNLSWCDESPIPTEIYNSINPSDSTTSKDTVVTKFNGKSQTEKILAAAAANSKPATYFGEANFCKSFAPGFKDGEWYLPSVGELLLINKSYSNILQSITKIYPSITSLTYNYWSSNQFSKGDSWYVYLSTGNASSGDVATSGKYLIPTISIK